MESTKKCIYCGKTKASSEFNTEHVLSVSLGRYRNALTIDCVCEECNSYFGSSIDLTLGRDSIEALLRIADGLKQPSGISELRFRNLRINLLNDTPWSGAATTVAFDNGEIVCDLVPQVGLDLEETGFQFFTIKELMEFTEPLKPVLKSPSKIKMLYRSDEDRDAILRELSRLGVDFHQEGELPSIDIKHNPIAELSISYTDVEIMKRALCKLAFNYLASQYGSAFALRTEFNDLRRYIREGSPPSWPFFLASRKEISLKSSARAGIEKCHYFMLDYGQDEREIVCRVHLFGTLDYNVRLAQSYSGLIRLDFAKGHYFNFDKKEVFPLYKAHIWVPPGSHRS